MFTIAEVGRRTAKESPAPVANYAPGAALWRGGQEGGLSLPAEPNVISPIANTRGLGE